MLPNERPRFRRASKLLAAALALLTGVAILAVSTPSRAEKHKLTVATLAPKKSAWGKVFTKWSKAVKKKTNGKLEIQFYWNASQGDDLTVVSKLKTGQLDGCTLGAPGLSEIHRPVLAMQMPGLFRTWKSIDRANKAMYPEFSEAFQQKGFYLSSIGDLGRARMFTKGKAVRLPKDMIGMKPASPQRSVVAPIMASVLGVTPVRVTFGELLPALSAGRINALTSPAIAAEQLQWSPFFDHVGSDVLGIGIGAVVFNQKRLDALPQDVIKVMEKTGKKASKYLRKRVRKMDDKAYKRMTKRMTVVKLKRREKLRWAAKFEEVRERLAQRVFTTELVERLEEIAKQKD